MHFGSGEITFVACQWSTHNFVSLINFYPYSKQKTIVASIAGGTAGKVVNLRDVASFGVLLPSGELPLATRSSIYAESVGFMLYGFCLYMANEREECV